MILVTGGTGFVGSAVVKRLAQDDWRQVVVATRQPAAFAFENVRQVDGPELRAHVKWDAALAGINSVIHCAARAHIMSETEPNALEAYRRVNVDGTLELARQAAAIGVRRFIFVSSIKVNGESTQPGRPFGVDLQAPPLDPYGLSKFEAEKGLRDLAKKSKMEVVIIRPPVVYGPNVKANFAAMMRLVSRGLPLPLGSVRSNRRSMVALDNLVDLIVTCLNRPAAANQTFLVSDGEDLSTAELLERVGRAMGRPARLIPVPEWLLSAGATALGKRAVAQRLLGSLQVDISKTREVLGWEPPVEVDEGLRRAVGQYRADSML